MPAITSGLTSVPPSVPGVDRNLDTSAHAAAIDVRGDEFLLWRSPGVVRHYADGTGAIGNGIDRSIGLWEEHIFENVESDERFDRGGEVYGRVFGGGAEHHGSGSGRGVTAEACGDGVSEVDAVSQEYFRECGIWSAGSG